MRRHGATLMMALLMGCGAVIAAHAEAGGHAGSISVGTFSRASPGGPLPEGWRPLSVPSVSNHTSYSLVNDAGITVLRAQSTAAASSLAYAARVDPKQFPLLEWRWKVNSLVKSGNIFTKAGDDYAARIYVFFDYDIDRLPFAQRVKIRMARLIYGQDLPVAALCYVWDNRAPIGTSVWSAYTDRVRMIVVESGDARLNEWIGEWRNVWEDYKAAFGEDPPAISGIAVGADTDNTGESTLSFFGDLSFSAPGR